MILQSIPCPRACRHQECSAARLQAIKQAEHALVKREVAASAPKLEAAVKLQPAKVVLEQQVDRAARKVRKAVAVSNAKTRAAEGTSGRNWLGFDDESVQRTGIIDGDGYRGRLKLKQMWEDERPVDPQFVVLAKFLFSYAYGQPGKPQEASKQRESLVFVTTSGLLPWDPRMDNMKDQTDALLASSAAEAKVLALEAAKKPEPVAADKDAGDTEIPETLELVEPAPDFNPGRGGR